MKSKPLPRTDQPHPANTASRIAPRNFEAPHALECEIKHALAIDSDVCLNSLVVRRTKNGVCLEGVLEFDDECPDLSKRIQALTGVEEVINHMVMKRRMPIPPKG
ncbi:hypothetical protein [Gimesia sp.]|uniref:hypothetical protein n=1 Tax=Gimesia sp. TaxID=2024833 RepID=UPI0032EB1502